MDNIDEFASSLLEESKRFLERAKEAVGDDAEAPFLHAALMLAFCALEAHVNSVADEFSKRLELSVHEKGVLLERDVQLQDGEFRITTRLKMSSMEDRIAVLHQKFAKKGFDGKAEWRSNLSGAIALRNKLTHPKSIPQITVAAVEKAVEAVIQTINALYLGLYKRALPAANLGLHSTLEF